MIRRIAIAVVVLVFLGFLVFSLLSWHAAIAPIERPTPASFSAESIAKGEVLAAEGHCLSCDIRPGGQPFAGGYGVNTPFGIIYGSNITPDPKTGIGGWSLEAFTRGQWSSPNATSDAVIVPAASRIWRRQKHVALA